MGRHPSVRLTKVHCCYRVGEFRIGTICPATVLGFICDWSGEVEQSRAEQSSAEQPVLMLRFARANSLSLGVLRRGQHQTPIIRGLNAKQLPRETRPQAQDLSKEGKEGSASRVGKSIKQKTKIQLKWIMLIQQGLTLMKTSVLHLGFSFASCQIF